MPVVERLYLIVDAVDESDAGERIDVINFLHECHETGRRRANWELFSKDEGFAHDSVES